MKKLLWPFLAAVASAAASALAIRLVRAAWVRIAHEPPPDPPRWATLVAGSTRKRVENRIEPSPV